MSKVAEQADIEMVSTTAVVRHPSFLRGVEEYRARKRPDFEWNDWEYERGSQWAAIAPCDPPFPQPVRFGSEVRF